MKLLMLIFAFTFTFILDSSAQGDSLVINLKQGPAEKIPISQLHKISFEDVTAVEGQPMPLSGLVVKGSHPNPSTDQISIEFEIASQGDVEVIIYDNNGNLIKQLVCENCPTGKNLLQWNCLDMYDNKVQSGVYYYEVRFRNEIRYKKMIVIQ